MIRNRIFFRAIVAGMAVTTFAFFCFPYIYNLFGVNHIFISLILSTVINVNVSYFSQRLFVYNSENFWLNEYIRFWGNSILIIILGNVALYFLVEILFLDGFISNFIVVVGSAILSFVLHYLITFKYGSQK